MVNIGRKIGDNIYGHYISEIYVFFKKNATCEYEKVWFVTLSLTLPEFFRIFFFGLSSLRTRTKLHLLVSARETKDSTDPPAAVNLPPLSRKCCST